MQNEKEDYDGAGRRKMFKGQTEREVIEEIHQDQPDRQEESPNRKILGK